MNKYTLNISISYPELRLRLRSGPQPQTKNREKIFDKRKGSLLYFLIILICLRLGLAVDRRLVVAVVAAVSFSDRNSGYDFNQKSFEQKSSCIENCTLEK